MELSDNLINLRTGYSNYIQTIDKVITPTLPVNRHKHLRKVIKRSMIIREIKYMINLLELDKEFFLGLTTFMGLIALIGIVFIIA